MANDRVHDIVVFGATGFTGELTAKYLARNAPADCKWALAGRDLGKLEATRRTLTGIDPACAELPLLHADVTDEDSLRALAQTARVVITTVGPYVRYGEPLVAACAEAGTDYVDLTGETEFVDRMYARHHTRAVATGARLVHACGFDSVPHDLGTHFTVAQLPSEVPLRVKGLVRAGGQLSGGTLYTVVTAFTRIREMTRAAAQRRRLEPRGTRRVRAGAGPARYDRKAGAWVVPLPSLDSQVIARSARTLESYGPDFTYRHYMAVKHLLTVVVGTLGLSVLFAVAQLPPARKALLRRLRPGDGPSPEKRSKSWFKVRFVGEGGGRRVVTEVAGGDPGYDETAKILAESALSLATDHNPRCAGQVTTAVAMGDALTRRLIDAGITFRVIHVEGSSNARAQQ